MLTTQNITVTADHNLLINLTFEEVTGESDFIPLQVTVQFGSRGLVFVQTQRWSLCGVTYALYKNEETGWLLKLRDANVYAVVSLPEPESGPKVYMGKDETWTEDKNQARLFANPEDGLKWLTRTGIDPLGSLSVAVEMI